LENGPLHEAFDRPITSGPSTGVTVDQEPPEPIDEIPPQYRMEGDNVEWIPGYWTWLDEQNDFVWVSGVWRALPPERFWTPGHWAEIADGYQWISGYWTSTEAEEVEYLPYPPDTLETGPSSPAPDQSYFWIPGCWQWTNNNYAWRPGYWYPGQANWLWMPNHYVYTPRGAVFVNGYWDYPYQRRGLLYAPVYWPGGYNYGRRFAPSRVLNTALLLSALFINSDRGYYYYGRGYGGQRNFSPWYGGYGNRVYSPLYNFYSWQYGRDSGAWRGRVPGLESGRGQGSPRNLVSSVEDLRATAGADQRGASSGASRVVRAQDSDIAAARERSHQIAKYRAARADFEASGEATMGCEAKTGPTIGNLDKIGIWIIGKRLRPASLDSKTSARM
jgi:hypothetical protein